MIRPCRRFRSTRRHHLASLPASRRAARLRRGDSRWHVIAGRFTLVEEIGEGGMGSVWVAQQTEPLKRTVAIKFAKAGTNSSSVLARFEQERQALALMDHPNIAQVYDAGLTPAGQPFFVMELGARSDAHADSATTRD
jgi:serine/threonine protein kinase